MESKTALASIPANFMQIIAPFFKIAFHKNPTVTSVPKIFSEEFRRLKQMKFSCPEQKVNAYKNLFFDYSGNFRMRGEKWKLVKKTEFLEAAVLLASAREEFRQELRSVYRPDNGPSLLIVHASPEIDRDKSARPGIERLINRLPAENIFEIVSGSSYLSHSGRVIYGSNIGDYFVPGVWSNNIILTGGGIWIMSF